MIILNTLRDWLIKIWFELVKTRKTIKEEGEKITKAVDGVGGAIKEETQVVKVTNEDIALSIKDFGAQNVAGLECICTAMSGLENAWANVFTQITGKPLPPSGGNASSSSMLSDATMSFITASFPDYDRTRPLNTILMFPSAAYAADGVSDKMCSPEIDYLYNKLTPIFEARKSGENIRDLLRQNFPLKVANNKSNIVSKFPIATSTDLEVIHDAGDELNGVQFILPLKETMGILGRETDLYASLQSRPYALFGDRLANPESKESKSVYGKICYIKELCK